MRSLDYEVYMSGSVSTLNLVVSYPVSTRIGVWFIWDYWLVTVLVLLLAQSSSEIPVSILLLLPTLVKLNVHTSSQLLPCHQWPWPHALAHYLLDALSEDPKWHNLLKLSAPAIRRSEICATSGHFPLTIQNFHTALWASCFANAFELCHLGTSWTSYIKTRDWLSKALT